MNSINQTHAEIKLLEIWKTIHDDDNLLKVEKINRPDLVAQTRSSSSLNLVESKVSVQSSKTFLNDAKKLWNRAPESKKTVSH